MEVRELILELQKADENAVISIAIINPEVENLKVVSIHTPGKDIVDKDCFILFIDVEKLK